jgi:hypothetical protein
VALHLIADYTGDVGGRMHVSDEALLSNMLSWTQERCTLMLEEAYPSIYRSSV